MVKAKINAQCIPIIAEKADRFSHMCENLSEHNLQRISFKHNDWAAFNIRKK